MQTINSEHYSIDDSVLSMLNLHMLAPVRIDVGRTGVKLFLGPLEYEWSRGCPDVCSLRTELQALQDGPQKDDLPIIRSC